MIAAAVPIESEPNFGVNPARGVGRALPVLLAEVAPEDASLSRGNGSARAKERLEAVESRRERAVAIARSPRATVYRFRRNGGVLHTHYANIGTRNNSLFIETRAHTIGFRSYRPGTRCT